MARTPGNSMIGPALAGAAALVAGAVWFIPWSLFVPEPELTSEEAKAKGAPKPAYEPARPNNDWAALAPKLENLREPWKAPVETAGGIKDEIIPVAKLTWEYIGTVDSPEARAAVVVINNQQKFVMEGERVNDPGWPNATIVLKAIHPDRLELDSNGAPETVKRKAEAAPALQTGAPSGADPSSLGSPTSPADLNPANPANPVTPIMPGRPGGGPTNPTHTGRPPLKIPQPAGKPGAGGSTGGGAPSPVPINPQPFTPPKPHR